MRHARRRQRDTSREFWQSSNKHADAQGPIEAWHAEAEKASWHSLSTTEGAVSIG